MSETFINGKLKFSKGQEKQSNSAFLIVIFLIVLLIKLLYFLKNQILL